MIGAIFLACIGREQRLAIRLRSRGLCSRFFGTGFSGMFVTSNGGSLTRVMKTSLLARQAGPHESQVKVHLLSVYKMNVSGFALKFDSDPILLEFV